jgi:hypothetical protein
MVWRNVLSPFLSSLKMEAMCVRVPEVERVFSSVILVATYQFTWYRSLEHYNMYVPY